MVPRVRLRRPTRRSQLRRTGIVLLAIATLGAIVALAGCGSTLRDDAAEDARADVDTATPGSCAASVLEALGGVAKRVYAEGVSSERTASALHMIVGSNALREAVEAGDAPATRTAARALIATGHLTNLRIVRDGKVLIDLGGPALAPFGGTLSDAAGKPIASFVTSVWAAGGLIAEGATTLQSGGRTFAGEFELPAGALPAQGTLTRNGVPYQYTSYAARSYPRGDAVRVFLLRAISSIEPLCGASSEDTVTNTLSHIARLIYEGEAGRRSLTQIHRVQRNGPLLRAVAASNPVATRAAVAALLHQHIVRLRVRSGSDSAASGSGGGASGSDGGRLLADVGGPFVLAPVEAPLRLGGRKIGSFVLSIQDDEGYKRLANRLAGLDVLMYMGSRLVKSTLGAAPGPVPTSGPFSFHGRSYRLYTFTAKAFPTGPLRITVLIPMPYS